LSSLLIFTNCETAALQKEIMNKEFKSETKINNVYLHFIHAILDEDAYDAIKKSDFLKNEFCNGEEKTHSSTNTSWTGFYLTGENIYIQLFSHKDIKNLQEMGVGNIGIEFMVDRKEEIEEITKLFKQKLTHKITHGIFEKNIDNTLIPWFYYIENLSLLPEVDSMILAYHQDYLTFKDKKISNQDAITRKEYNEKYNAIPFDKTKLFKDVEEVTLSLNAANKRKFIEQQTLLEHTCEEEKDYTICRGPGIIFKIKPSQDESCKLLKLQMSLNYEINNLQIYKLGNSTIELEHKTAIWTFNEENK